MVWALSMINIYRAETLLAPADEKAASAGSALLNQLEGLAHLAGVGPVGDVQGSGDIEIPSVCFGGL